MTATLGGSVDARISGDVSGQIAVGNNIVQYHVEHGGVVNVAAPEQRPEPRPRPLPLPAHLRGRRPRSLVGRERELGAARAALEEGLPLQFHGPPGVGKTSLLKTLAHLPSDPPDGVLYHMAHGEDVEDILQFLYETFYDSPVKFKATEAELRHGLGGAQVRIIVDDLGVARDDLETLLDFLPAATFAVASPSRSLWGDGKSVGLGGLGPEAGLALLERELGRPLEGDEREAGLALVAALEGKALRILEAAAHLTESGQSVRSLADELTAARADVAQKLVDSLTPDQRAVLEVLTALGGATLPAPELAEITGVANAGEVVEALIAKSLVQAHSPRYSVTDGPAVARFVRADAWDGRLVDFFSGWAERNRRTPEKVLDNSAAVLAVLDRTARTQSSADLLRLSRAVEEPFGLTGRWGAWKRTLDHELTAARRTGNRASEGWALHQLGTRALCLGQEHEARSRLTGALRIRESLGDVKGAAVTRHNLALLPGGGVVTKPAAVAATAGGLSLLAVLAIVVSAILVLAGLVVGTRALGGGVATGDLSGLTLAPARHDFGERPALDPSPPRTVMVTNGADGAVALESLALVGAGEAFRVEDDTCRGVTLDPGSACTLAVLFNPPQPGPFEARLVARGGGGEGPSTILTGVGTPSANGGNGATSVLELSPGPEPPTPLLPPPSPSPPPPPPPAAGCSVRAPAAQSVRYGAPLRLTASADASPTPTLEAEGLPAGVSLVDDRNGTATIAGTVLAAPGRYAPTLTATTAGRACPPVSFAITVAKAPVTVDWLQPLVDITPGSPATATALVTQTAGTRGDLTQASVAFIARNTLTGEVFDLGPSPVDAAGASTLDVAPGELPAGAYTARAHLLPNDYFATASTPPVAVVVNTDVLGATVYALSDLLENFPSF